MDKGRIIKLVTEEARLCFPGFETDKPTYFYDVVQEITEEFLEAYNMELVGDDEHTKKLIALELERFKKTIE